MSRSPLVSVIVPTYNSARTIEHCLISIQNQSYLNIEILVVDNNSTDATKQLAKKYTENVYNFGPERTFQKNKGIQEAKGKYICFIDSDMELTNDVVEKGVELFEGKIPGQIGGICFPERSRGDGLFVKIRDFERSFYSGTGVESARFYKLEDVRSVGGFEEDLIFFEESLLPQKIESKLGKSCTYSVSAYINHNEDAIQLVNRLTKKFYYGKSLDKYRQKVEELGIQQTANDQIGIIGRYLIFLRKRRFYSKPFLALCVLSLKTMEFIAGGLGFLFARILKNG